MNFDNVHDNEEDSDNPDFDYRYFRTFNKLCVI